MTRKFDGDTLVVASHNKGKVREIAALLGPYVATFRSAAELDLPEPEETGDTFIANAELKARAAASSCGLIALSDDSGLVVPGIGGQPGIYSARWAGADKDFSAAMERVNRELGNGDRTAYFVSALTLAWPDGHCESVEGRVYGKLAWPVRGGNGFGYDPMFVPDGYDITFGEMDPAEKHRISHRADAFKQLVERCFA
jgi:XTP/dITP diphosphohydrolase